MKFCPLHTSRAQRKHGCSAPTTFSIRPILTYEKLSQNSLERWNNARRYLISFRSFFHAARICRDSASWWNCSTSINSAIVSVMTYEFMTYCCFIQQVSASGTVHKMSTGMLRVHSPDGSTSLRGMTSWPPSRKCDVKSKIPLRQSMRIYLKTSPRSDFKRQSLRAGFSITN